MWAGSNAADRDAAEVMLARGSRQRAQQRHRAVAHAAAATTRGPRRCDGAGQGVERVRREGGGGAAGLVEAMADDGVEVLDVGSAAPAPPPRPALPGPLERPLPILPVQQRQLVDLQPAAVQSSFCAPPCVIFS